MRFPIGTKYMSSGKYPKLCEVVNYEVTFNKDSELLKFRYTSKNELMTQEIIIHDVVYTSIIRRVLPEQFIPVLVREFDKLIMDNLRPMTLKECKTFISKMTNPDHYLIYELGRPLPQNTKSTIDYNWGV